MRKNSGVTHIAFSFFPLLPLCENKYRLGTRRRETLTSLAKKFNLKVSGIKQARSRFYDFLNRNAEMRLKIEKIKENL